MNMEEQMIAGGMGNLGAAANPTKFTGPVLESPFLQERQFNSISPAHEYAFKSQLVHGFPYTNSGVFFARRAEYYHKLTIATTDRKFTFFNANATDFVSNMKNGEVPSNRPLWLRSIQFRPIEVDSAGALTANYSAYSTANTTAIQNLLALQKTLSNGVIRLFVANSVWLEAFGADRMPAGGGARADMMGISGTTIATGYQVNFANIGDTNALASLQLDSPIPLLPGKNVSLTVDLQGATVPAAGQLAAFLVGTEVVPVNFLQ